jgi:hypothetical protein
MLGLKLLVIALSQRTACIVTPSGAHHHCCRCCPCQARYSYYPNDMRMNERFATLYMMFKGKKLGLDLSEFDATVPLGA